MVSQKGWGGHRQLQFIAERKIWLGKDKWNNTFEEEGVIYWLEPTAFPPQEVRISLTEDNFRQLVKGEVVSSERNGVKALVCLQDIGYMTMSEIIEFANQTSS